MLRFDAKKGVCFYPSVGDEQERTLQVNKGSTYEKNVMPRNNLCVVKCGMGIPRDSGSYEDFVRKIKIKESIFKERLLMR